MKKQKLPFIFTFLFIGGISMCQSNDEGKARNPSASLIIPAQELEELSIKAIRGDGEAAMRISQHYSIGHNDESIGLYWDTIGAENDHTGNQWNLSYSLMYSNKLDMRGIFWCIQAARGGEEYAINKLRRLGISPDTQYFDEIVYTNNDGISSENEIEACTENALKGSTKAALVLANYYRKINDKQSMGYWYRIGAQNGNPECQYSYGQILKQKEGEDNHIRGDFWINKAIKNGFVN
jgi:TPR repeat protein